MKLVDANSVDEEEAVFNTPETEVSVVTSLDEVDDEAVFTTPEREVRVVLLIGTEPAVPGPTALVVTVPSVIVVELANGIEVVDVVDTKVVVLNKSVITGSDPEVVVLTRGVSVKTLSVVLVMSGIVVAFEKRKLVLVMFAVIVT